MKSQFAFTALLVLACARASAADILPLRHGAYVNSQVPCQQASNSTLTWYDGRYFYEGRGFTHADWKRCSVRLESRQGATYVILRSCRNVAPNDDLAPRSEETYIVKAPTAFSIKGQFGASSYRLCAQPTLPVIWRGPNPY